MPKFKIIRSDFREKINRFNPVINGIDTIFADPPDNIGLGYEEHVDKMSREMYLEFLGELVQCCLAVAKTTYISFNSKWMSEMGGVLSMYPKAGWIPQDTEIKWLIQGFTFGQHNHHDFGNNFRPIVRLRRPDAPMFPDNCRIESDRMKMGDKRANPAGRVPGDVWFNDFLEYSRVTGNSKQRRKWHPTQLHEGLVEDCLLMTTPPGGTVLDPFCGTGTTLRVCMANGWSCTTMDISRQYCEKVAEENQIPELEDGLWYKEV